MRSMTSLALAALLAPFMPACSTSDSGGQMQDSSKPGAPAAATAACAGGEPEAEEYAVMSAAIAELFAKEAERLVITVQSNEAMLTNDGDPALPVPKETVEDFKAKNAKTSCLKASFKVDRPVVMLDESEASTFFKGDDIELGWSRFYEKYPKSQGIMKLSRVAFSPDRSRALLYVGNQKAGLDGAGFLLIMEKRGGSWAVADQRPLWIS